MRCERCPRISQSGRGRFVPWLVCGLWGMWALSVCPACGECEAAAGSPKPTEEPAKRSLEQIRTCLIRYYAKLDGMDVEYEVLGGEASSEPILVRYAFKGQRRYSASTQPGESSPDYIGGLTNGIYWYFQPKLLKAGIIPAEKAGDAIQYDAYVDALHIALSDDDRSAAYLVPRFLPMALDAPGAEWRVRPMLEQVDGRLCHVLEGRTLKLWLDVELGCAPRYAELYGEVNGATRRTASYHYADLTEIADGLYLPRLVVVTAYALNGQQNRPTRSQRLKVVRLVIGDAVKDSLFEPAFPPGTTVLDAAKGRRYVAGSPEAAVSRLTTEARGALPGAAGHRPTTPRPITWIVLAGAGAIAAVGLLWYWLRRQAGGEAT